MQEIQIDIRQLLTGQPLYNQHGGILAPMDAVCFTSNGFVKNNGDAVMGRGTAYIVNEFMRKEGARKLGNAIRANGNVVQVIQEGLPAIVSFPVKPVSRRVTRIHIDTDIVEHLRAEYENQVPCTVPGWACVAEMSIISSSILGLLRLTDGMGWSRVALPKPGCGAGELQWERVKPLLSEWLDERFFVFDRGY
jgi:hypothetical protein